MEPDEQFVVDWPTLWIVPEWVEAHCVIPNGFRKGQQFKLLRWQTWCLLNFYRVKPTAVWNPSDPVLGPAFHYRRAQVMKPQKSGKGPYTAAHICVEAVGPALFGGWAAGGEVYDCRDYGCGCGWSYEYEPVEPMGIPWPTPLIQIVAFSDEQAIDNVYNHLRPMIELGPLVFAIPKTGVDSTRLPGGGRIDTVTSSARSRLGNPTTFAAQDETGLYTAANGMVDLAQTQRRSVAGMGGRSEETTNAYNKVENSTAQRTAESNRPDIFRYAPQAPAGLSYRDKRERRKIHRFVYGSSLREFGGHVDLDSIEAEALELLIEDPDQAERFFGNRSKAGAGTWLPDGLWGSRKRLREVPDRTAICLGFDGSEFDDWTGLRAETLDGYQFTPTFGPDQLPTVWNPKRFDGRIPHGEVDAAVDELMRRYRVVRMYCDPRDWQTDIERWALKYGSKRVFEWPTNRISAMHAALVRMVADLGTGVLWHDDCPDTALHVGNARKVVKSGERYLLGKPSPHQKIDLAMCSSLVHEAACDAVKAGEGRQAVRRQVVVS